MSSRISPKKRRVLKIEPRASHMTGKRVTTELHSQLCQFEIISGR